MAKDCVLYYNDLFTICILLAGEENMLGNRLNHVNQCQRNHIPMLPVALNYVCVSDTEHKKRLLPSCIANILFYFIFIHFVCKK